MRRANAQKAKRKARQPHYASEPRTKHDSPMFPVWNQLVNHNTNRTSIRSAIITMADFYPFANFHRHVRRSHVRYTRMSDIENADDLSDDDSNEVAVNFNRICKREPTNISVPLVINPIQEGSCVSELSVVAAALKKRRYYPGLPPDPHISDWLLSAANKCTELEFRILHMRCYDPDVLYQGVCNYDDNCSRINIRICGCCGIQICLKHAVISDRVLCFECYRERVPLDYYKCNFCNLVFSSHHTTFYRGPTCMQKHTFRKPLGCKACCGTVIAKPMAMFLTPGVDERSINRLNHGCIVTPHRYMNEVRGSLLILYDDIFAIIEEYLCHNDYSVSCRTPYGFLMLRSLIHWRIRDVSVYNCKISTEINYHT